MTNRPTKSGDPVQISRFVQPRHISVESKSSRLMAVAVAASIFFLTWCCSVGQMTRPAIIINSKADMVVDKTRVMMCPATRSRSGRQWAVSKLFRT